MIRYCENLRDARLASAQQIIFAINLNRDVVVTFVDLRVPLKCDGVRYERVKSPLRSDRISTSESST